MRSTHEPVWEDVTPDNVWQFRQNKVRYIIRDLADRFCLDEAGKKAVALCLMARGVCKWLHVRRDLIRLKDEWKRDITRRNNVVAFMRAGTCEHSREAGELAMLVRCREQVRELCHSERWVLGADERDAQVMRELGVSGTRSDQNV